MSPPTDRTTTRRDFLRRGALVLAAATATIPRRLDAGAPAEGPGAEGEGPGPDESPVLRVGILTDVHYADKDPAGTRSYRDAIPRMAEAVARFREAKADLAIELGDFVDGADTPATERGWLERIEREYATFPGDRHHVLGNHCVWTLTKEEFLETCGQKAAHYSFDRGGFHFVILDACYRSDGVPYGRRNNEWTDADVPPAEREWLAADLARTELKTVAFIHQRLDVENEYAAKSAAAVRKILDESGKVLAVLQGHNHLNDHRRIGGIHYVTLAALVDGLGETGGAYGIFEVFRDGSLRIDGFRNQEDREIERPRRIRV